MKDILREQFGTYNLANYPECIRLIMKSHQTLSFRKVQKLKNAKLIIAIPKQESLAEITQKISATQVNLHYDHILYFDTNVLNEIKAQSNIDFVEEFFTVVENNKNEKQFSAPKGLQVQLSKQYEQLIYQCIRAWFNPMECYWLD